jgi:hypothetical protein
MHSLNGIYVQQMVETIQRDMEREHVRRQLAAGLPKSSFAASIRRVLGATFIGAGTVILGRPKAEPQAESSASP